MVTDSKELLHKLNNQLGVILAHAELLETKAQDASQKARASQVVNAALANQSRFDEMREFFGNVGEGHAAGVWEDTPKENVAFREKYRKQIEAQAKKRKAEEMI